MEQVLVVTHGAFAHFLTEDWEVEDPMVGTAWKNCRYISIFSLQFELTLL